MLDTLAALLGQICITISFSINCKTRYVIQNYTAQFVIFENINCFYSNCICFDFYLVLGTCSDVMFIFCVRIAPNNAELA